MEENIKLTYVITTFNKVSYLRQTLPLLIKARKADEEIIVTDGGSKDGTKDYLGELFKDRQIQHFVSEPDKGESHGFNKAILMAKGELIKIITDDDIYNYNAIEQCKGFMLANPVIDVIGFDGYSYNTPYPSLGFRRSAHFELFKQWKKNGKPFIFCGLSLMIRKSAIAAIGLLNTQFIIVDYEYTLRLTSQKINLAWYSGNHFVNLVTENSNSVKFSQRWDIEMEKIRDFYLDKNQSKLLKRYDLFNKIKHKVKYFGRKKKGTKQPETGIDYDTAFKMSVAKLAEDTHQNEFYT